MAKIIGIDLGTTNSCVAIMEGEKPRVIENSEGARTTPSVVAYLESGEILVGAAAKRQAVTNPKNTIYAVKRLIGRKFPEKEVQKDIALMPYKIVAADNSDAWVEVRGEKLAPQQISAEILRKMKKTAEDYLGEKVVDAVITVPAYFNDAQRQATKDAGRIAGLEVLRLVNEPTAASLAYGLDKRENGVIAVYDLGGGTFDISILKLHDGIFEVLATNGDTHLGGDDIDNRLIQIALEDIQSEWGDDISVSGEAVQLLRRAVIEAKEKLSFAPAVNLELVYNGKAYRRQITRELFENLIRDIVDRTMGPCRSCIADAGVTVEQIDEVVMVGGSTRVPMVRAAVETLFRAKPHTELNPDEVVALGAAVQASILSGDTQDKLLLDVTPLSLGIEMMGGVVSKLIHRNSTIPASETEAFTTAVDGQRNVLIHVVQGERELARDCRSLARFDLKDIQPMPAGMARIEVKFLIDANGILNVTARDVRTGREQSVEVKPSYGLTDDQVEAMIIESIDNAEADFKERQLREARVEADAILGAMDKAKQSDAWAELTDEERAEITLAMNQLILAYHHDDYLLVLAMIERLNNVTMKLAENMMNTAVRGALKGTKI